VKALESGLKPRSAVSGRATIENQHSEIELRRQMARIDLTSKWPSLADDAYGPGDSGQVLGQSLQESAAIQALADHQPDEAGPGVEEVQVPSHDRRVLEPPDVEVGGADRRQRRYSERSGPTDDRGVAWP
jgi:hypothetical protein